MKKKIETIDPLTARRREISRALYDHRQTPGGTLGDEQRIWLEREKRHYNDGGDLAGWQVVYDRIRALQANAAAVEAEKAATAEAAKSAELARMQEREDALRAKIAEEADPLTQWKRQHAARTF